jgi:hypothetical protein
MAPGVNMLVTLDNNQLVSQLTNQGPIPIFAESETKFFPKVVDAELEFSGSDAQGRATQLTLHQGGRDIPLKRLDDGEFKRLSDAAANLAKRVKEQTPMPGSEETLRRTIESLRLGQPNYESMSANLANVVRQQLSQQQTRLAELGPVQSVAFKGVGPAGADIYLVKFANGSVEYRIVLGADGKIETLASRPAQ